MLIYIQNLYSKLLIRGSRKAQYLYSQGQKGGIHMAKLKPLETSVPVSVETAWREQGEKAAVEAAILKYAKVIDMTDAGRDMKPLITGMFEAIDRYKSLEAVEGSAKKETPLFSILKAVNE
jgi:hypothetical protein